MENATKALLIAAAVLIAIVLVALGVNLLGSTGDTTEDAKEVADQIGSSTSSAVSSLNSALDGLTGDKITFFIDTMEFELETDEPVIYKFEVPKRINMGRFC